VSFSILYINSGFSLPFAPNPLKGAQSEVT
jgi:hypothetical protein